MSIPTTQVGVVVHEKNGPLVLQKRAVPTPAENQLLVKLTAAAVNPVDYKMQRGFFDPAYPVMLGTDSAGIVVALGSKVSNFAVGDRVFFQSEIFVDDQSAFQQYNIIPSDIASKIPANITDEEASTIPVAVACAFVGLFKTAAIPFPIDGPTAVGKTIVVVGGSSSVGQYVIQLARIAGFSTIITTVSLAHKELVQRLGATHVVDRKSASVAADVKSIIANNADSIAPISVVFDTISLEEAQHLALDIVEGPTTSTADAVAIIVLAPLPSVTARASPIPVKHVDGFSHSNRGVSVPFWKSVGGWLEKGIFVPNKVEVVGGGLKNLQAVFDRSREGVSGYKLVIKPQEGLE